MPRVVSRWLTTVLLLGRNHSYVTFAAVTRIMLVREPGPRALGRMAALSARTVSGCGSKSWKVSAVAAAVASLDVAEDPAAHVRDPRENPDCTPFSFV